MNEYGGGGEGLIPGLSSIYKSTLDRFALGVNLQITKDNKKQYAPIRKIIILKYFNCAAH
jgi:hypothetical protein